MVPLNSSPPTPESLSTPSRPTDYFGRTWEHPSFGPYKNNASAPRIVGMESCPVITSTQPDIVVQKDLRPKQRGSSRHRLAAKSREHALTTSKSAKAPSQKTMLSKALQKANTAVLLDNAQNFEGAMQAYLEACALLFQVMMRSTGDEDYQKLESIHETYTDRISELEKVAPHLTDDSKALPARPENEIHEADDQEIIDQGKKAGIKTAQAPLSRNSGNQKYATEHSRNQSITVSQLPPRRESLLQAGSDSSSNVRDSSHGRTYTQLSHDKPNSLEAPMDSLYMPPPLSPRRPPSPRIQQNSRNLDAKPKRSPETTNNGHARLSSSDSISWLDTIQESGAPDKSSIRENKSPARLLKNPDRASDSSSEAQFDAALDAAVKAAYDDSYFSRESREKTSLEYDEDEVVANVRRKVELAKEKVRQSEREAAVQLAQDRERTRRQHQQQFQDVIDDEYDDNEAEEEERLLEEMTRSYENGEQDLYYSGKHMLSREPPLSSTFSQRTWNGIKGPNSVAVGSVASHTPNSTTLPPPPLIQSKIFSATPLPPPPALPPPPSSPTHESPSSSIISASPGSRSRRFSKQNPNQLKIETTSKTLVEHPEPSAQSLYFRNSNGSTISQPRGLGLIQNRQNITLTADRPPRSHPPPSISSKNPSSNSNLLSNASLQQNVFNDIETLQPGAGSPNRGQSRNGIRSRISSSSLKNLKGRNVSSANVIAADGSENPLNNPSNPQSDRRTEGRRSHPNQNYLSQPTPLMSEERQSRAQSANMSLFNSEMNIPESAGLPSAHDGTAPIPLEPCPTEFLLRPFWLMRALYQTITHPKGGYISSKLFVPCDVWQVKGVKIKNVEEKITNCDMLTSALSRLARVDSIDADAVLEEMQSFENTMEQAQATLSKKLGNDVGIQNLGGLGASKDLAVDADAEGGGGLSKSSTTSSKSSFSWRRLRSKNSGVGLSGTYSTKTTVDGAKEGHTLVTLPMTSAPSSKNRFVRRDPSQIVFSGPNAGYMGALARLFDAAQVIDQIARQVDDPGLRHADKTQVGLELCIRHAAEFFGFYICRFAMTDVTMLLDKFIKRGGEWVLV